MKNLLIITISIFYLINANAQQIEFDTWLAFEDAAGRRDTVWYGKRNSATYGYDPALGEQIVKQPVDSGKFLVTTSIGALDNKILDNKFYIKGEWPFEIFINLIFINVTYPITMQFDTTFFKDMSPYYRGLNQYIGSWCTDPGLVHPWNESYSVFSCIKNGSVIINEPPNVNNDPKVCATSPWVVDLDIGNNGLKKVNAYSIETILAPECFHKISVGTDQVTTMDKVSIFPNPTTGHLNILSDYKDGYIIIDDLLGNRIRTIRNAGDQNISTDLDPGIYIIRFENQSESRVIGKVVVR